MTDTLIEALELLSRHREDLQTLVVLHAAVFGSVARGEASEESDVDILVELDPARPLDLFDYARVRLFVEELFGGKADVVNRRAIKPPLRDPILRDAIEAF